MKPALRKQLRERLDLLSFDELLERSGKLSDRFQAWSQVFHFYPALRGKTLLNFYPFGSEPQIQVEPKIPGLSLPYRLGYLRIEDWDQRLMVPREARRDVPDLWEEFELPGGKNKIFQPKGTQPEIDLSSIEVVLVPGLGFGRNGERLGRGAGFYDRFLQSVPHALRVGVAFQVQILDSVPMESHDLRVDLLLTDEDQYETSRYREWKNRVRIE